MNNKSKYIKSINSWLKLSDAERRSGVGIALRVTAGTAWGLMCLSGDDAANSIPAEMRPEAVFKGYQQ